MDEIKGGDTPEERPSDGSSSSSDTPEGGPPKKETPGAPPKKVDAEGASSEESSSEKAPETPGDEAADQSGDKAAGEGTGTPEEPKTPAESGSDAPSTETPDAGTPVGPESPSEATSKPESTSPTETEPSADSPAGDAPETSSDSEEKTEEPGEKPIHYPEDPDEDYSAFPSSLMPPKEGAEAGAKPPSAPAAPPPPPPGGGDDADFGEDDDDDDDWDEEEDGMLRMSFMDHLEELRSRLISIVIGGGLAFFLAVLISYPLWNWVQAPLRAAVTVANGRIIAITPMEQFTIIWMWSPLVAAIYMAAPWVIYQIWAFVAPGLYPNERKWAGPFILVTAGLFVSGGLFAYYIAFPMALQFLLTIGSDVGVEPTISIDSYFSLFVNVMLGVSVLFLMPVAVFFLTLLRITTPGFLMRNARYAVLIIVILAAVITPTPDPVNLTLFAVPMILLFFLGVFASYLLVLHREGQRFPWKAFFLWLAALLILIVIGIALAIIYFDYRIVLAWPPLIR